MESMRKLQESLEMEGLAQPAIEMNVVQELACNCF
jgi:hypothetical protein